MTVGKGFLQVQTGFTYSNTSLESTFFDFESSSFAYTLNPRIGVTERLEFNALFALQSDNVESGFNGEEMTFSGLSAFVIGGRYNISQGDGNSPTIAVQADVSLTAVGEDFQAENASPRVLLTYSQGLNDWLTLTTNFGGFIDGNTDDLVGIYIANFSFPLSDRVGAFVEAFANSANGDFDISFDTGVGYLINNDLQLDASFGYGNNDDIKSWFIDAGLSWRVDLSN